MSDLKELIERIRALTGPDRETDVRIALAVGWDIRGVSEMSFSEMTERFGFDWALETATEYNSIYNTLPSYTASVDAALLTAKGIDPEARFGRAVGILNWAVEMLHFESADDLDALPRFILIASLQVRDRLK